MDSFKGQGGIQMLLTAEQEAQSIVSNARNLKTARLKQAKDEADREVANYRSNLEADYQNRKSEMSSGATAKRLEEETEAKIQNLKESATRVSSDIVDMLLNYMEFQKPVEKSFNKLMSYICLPAFCAGNA